MLYFRVQGWRGVRKPRQHSEGVAMPPSPCLVLENGVMLGIDKQNLLLWQQPSPAGPPWGRPKSGLLGGGAPKYNNGVVMTTFWWRPMTTMDGCALSRPAHVFWSEIPGLMQQMVETHKNNIRLYRKYEKVKDRKSVV